MYQIYAILIILNNNEIRLSFTEASSEEKAIEYAQYEYRHILDQATHIEAYPAKLDAPHDFKEVAIHFFGGE